MSESLLSRDKTCYVCGTTQGLHRHHVYAGNGRRDISEREGCWVYLCGPHHNLSDKGVHFNAELDHALKARCERAWMNANSATVSDFIKTFGRNYL